MGAGSTRGGAGDGSVLVASTEGVSGFAAAGLFSAAAGAVGVTEGAASTSGPMDGGALVRRGGLGGMGLERRGLGSFSSMGSTESSSYCCSKSAMRLEGGGGWLRLGTGGAEVGFERRGGGGAPLVAPERRGGGGRTLRSPDEAFDGRGGGGRALLALSSFMVPWSQSSLSWHFCADGLMTTSALSIAGVNSQLCRGKRPAGRLSRVCRSRAINAPPCPPPRKALCSRVPV